ncbi:MAG: iron-containing alcohol dehydrogenase [Chloroflexi bacterium]|nr:MAG: iron-containing alcohol dehydrogenase [Chloroflexota bacterium]
MWFFRSPEIVFGEGALDHLAGLEGRRAPVVTDRNVERLGLVRQVTARLHQAGLEVSVFAEVEPNPCLETVQRGAKVALEVGPDWIVALGGGSCLDAAKSIWIQYERPDLGPDDVAPMGRLGLRQKARLIGIPTTSGTGAEVTWPIVLTDTEEHRKISVGHPENIPDLAIVDPALVRGLPPQITADTGMDVLTHAVEGYTSQWHNDFADGLCLKAIQLVFDYLPRAYDQGCDDEEARERMHNAATIAGLGFGNSMAALAHGLGHAIGALLPIPHGRAVGLCLPYTVEFSVRGDLPTRYRDVARLLGLAAGDEAEAAAALAAAVRRLARNVGQPTSLREAGVLPGTFEAKLASIVENAFFDSATLIGSRIPEEEDVERLLRCIYEGRPVDF